MFQESVAKEVTENFDGKEERLSIFAARDPPRLVGTDSATRHDAMDMRMEVKILTPSVKHGEEADGRAQMLGVRRDGEQCLGNCPKEDAIDDPGILERQSGNLLRQSKDHVEILHRQQLGFPFGQP
jgi:hypothetical protein